MTNCMYMTICNKSNDTISMKYVANSYAISTTNVSSIFNFVNYVAPQTLREVLYIDEF